MPILTSCCCWDTLSAGSRGAAVFTGITGLINLIIDIWMLVNIHRLYGVLEDHEEYIYLPPGILPIIYIELFFSLCLFGLAFVLWIGINYGYDGRKLVFTWVYSVIGIRVYEFFLLIYVLTWIGGHRVMDVVYVVPESIGVAVYWLVDSVILLAAILCVISYWQELLDTIHGKAKRARYYTKLSNIRAAAFGGSGAATPMRSMYTSRAMLHASQPSIAQFSQYSAPPSMPPSMPPSQPQSAQPMGPGQFRYPPPQRPMGPQGYGPPGPRRPMGPGQPQFRPMGQGPPPQRSPMGQGPPPQRPPMGPGYGPRMGPGYGPPMGPGYGPPQRGGPYPPQERRGPPPDRRPPQQAMQDYFDEPPLKK